MLWHTFALGDSVLHRNVIPAGRPGFAGMEVRHGKRTHVELFHTDATGQHHTYRVVLGPQHVAVGGTSYPDPPPHDKTHRLRELVANHHKQHDSWPAILDEIESHPQLGPLMSEAISHHINARVS